MYKTHNCVHIKKLYIDYIKYFEEIFQIKE